MVSNKSGLNSYDLVHSTHQHVKTTPLLGWHVVGIVRCICSDKSQI